MIISEDKFLNKSAEEIISDMLLQHKNNSKEALEHIQDILNTDGLISNDNTKNELKKAAEVLSNKNLNEGWISSLINKFKKPQINNAELIVFPSFKKDPIKVTINDIKDLEDPRIDEEYRKLRMQYAHSPIQLRSPLGNKTIYENTINEYTIKAIKKDGKIDIYEIGNDKLAEAFAKKLLEFYPNQYQQVSLIKDKNNLKEYVNLKEDEITPEEHSWLDNKKDITDLDERLSYSLHGIHPNMGDKRRPKWHNTLNNRSNIITLRRAPDTSGEVYLILNGIDTSKGTPSDDDKVIVTEKIPVDMTEDGYYVYENGKSYYITVKQFKDMINDPQNAEILTKFKNQHPESPEYMLQHDLLAKKAIDNAYSEWEKEYSNLYDLDNYSFPEKAKIYQRWKEANKTTMYQKGHELTPEEVKNEFGIPKLIKDLKNLKINDKVIVAIENIIKQLPADKAAQLQNEFNTLINEYYEEDPDIILNRLKQWLEIPMLFACENKVNKVVNNKLIEIENSIHKEDKDQFEQDKNEILKKYIINGIPRVLGYEKQIIQDINDLAKKYNYGTWRKNVYKVKSDLSNKKDTDLDWEDIANELVTIKKDKETIPLLPEINNIIDKINIKDLHGLPLSANYRKLFNDKISKWKTKYPDPTHPELGEEIKKFYKELKDELKKYPTLTKELDQYL